MLKPHLVVQNAAAMAKWYAEVLGATAAQPMAALRFISPQAGSVRSADHRQALALEHTELG